MPAEKEEDKRSKTKKRSLLVYTYFHNLLMYVLHFFLLLCLLSLHVLMLIFIFIFIPFNSIQYVGKPTFTSDRLYEGASAPPGVVMGLAWTAMGGSSLYVEAMAIRPPTSASASSSSSSSLSAAAAVAVSGENVDVGTGSAGGRLRTTGQLGDVMNESAQVCIHSTFTIMFSVYGCCCWSCCCCCWC